MIQKIENCIYCGNKMESKTAKKKFCSNKCRVYFNREIEIESGEIIKLPIKERVIHINKQNEPKKHKLWKEGDPEEGTNAFFMRKGAFTYDEIDK